MNLYHYYHIYADGDWQRIVNEHFEALYSSGLGDELAGMRIGIVGDWDEQDKVIDFLRSEHSYRLEWWLLSQAEKGWEQITLNAMRKEVQSLGDGIALYAHTKGVANPGHHPDAWRRKMTEQCVSNYRNVIDQMIVGCYDTAGCYEVEEAIYEPGVPLFAGVHGVSSIIHRLRSESNQVFEYDGDIEEPMPILKRKHYSGNFWWATLDWIRRLQYPCDEQSRWDAEFYVGKAADGSIPLALNLHEGNAFAELLEKTKGSREILGLLVEANTLMEKKVIDWWKVRRLFDAAADWAKWEAERATAEVSEHT